MLGCYPNGRPADPQTYFAAVVTVLAEYPPEIVAKVTDPASGIAIRQTFLPSVSEIHAALESEMSVWRRRWREEYERGKAAKEVPVITDEDTRKRVAAEFDKLSASIAKSNAAFTYGADEGRRPPKDGETAS